MRKSSRRRSAADKSWRGGSCRPGLLDHLLDEERGLLQQAGGLFGERTEGSHTRSTPPPRASAANRQPLPGIAVLWTAVAATVLGLVYEINPSKTHYYPVCQFHALTGLNCPGCGMTRALYQLLHGHLLAALHLNALFTLALPCAAVVGARRWWARRTGRPVRALMWTPAWTWLLLSMIAAFGILRNIPFYPFTLLAP
jgi:Protein of unknown function (DUF2752)